jgi:4'-phosphopantetheinyl transferase
VGIRAILFVTVIEGVHIWRAALDGSGWPSAAELPRPEREHASAFLREQVARRWVASRWALRSVLGRYLDQAPVKIELELGEQGKPRLLGGYALEFNLSHSEGLALVAVAERPVGIDVEMVRPGRDLRALAERALPADDIAAVHAASTTERSAVFYRAWTQHEARQKCLGTGLGSSPSGTPVAVENISVAPGYAAAVGVAGRVVGPVLCRSLFAG